MTGFYAEFSTGSNHYTYYSYYLHMPYKFISNTYSTYTDSLIYSHNGEILIDQEQVLYCISSVLKTDGKHCQDRR